MPVVQPQREVALWAIASPPSPHQPCHPSRGVIAPFSPPPTPLYVTEETKSARFLPKPKYELESPRSRTHTSEGKWEARRRSSQQSDLEQEADILNKMFSEYRSKDYGIHKQEQDIATDEETADVSLRSRCSSQSVPLISPPGSPPTPTHCSGSGKSWKSLFQKSPMRRHHPLQTTMSPQRPPRRKTIESLPTSSTMTPRRKSRLALASFLTPRRVKDHAKKKPTTPTGAPPLCIMEIEIFPTTTGHNPPVN